MKQVSLIISLVLALVATGCKKEQKEMQVSRGTLTVVNSFPSTNVPPRAVRIWTPENYPNDSLYDVLYMHDGQMLFDSACTWNHQEWGVDEVVQMLIDSALIRPCIVVGVDNEKKRIEEYTPDDVVEFLPAGSSVYALDEALGNRYLQFLVEELKPYIDSAYAVYTTPEHTFVMGSSCGGLISSYALCKYPCIFGGAACLSTHSLFNTPFHPKPCPASSEAYLQYLTHRLPAANSRLLYMDCGDQTIDAGYIQMQQRIDSVVLSLGWDSAHYVYRFFPGAAHTETDWQQRLHIPLVFLLGKEQ